MDQKLQWNFGGNLCCHSLSNGPCCMNPEAFLKKFLRFFNIKNIYFYITRICNSRPNKVALQSSWNNSLLLFSMLVSLRRRLLLKSSDYMWGWWFFNPKHVLFILVCWDLCWEHEIRTDKLESNLPVMMLQEKKKNKVFRLLSSWHMSR